MDVTKLTLLIVPDISSAALIYSPKGRLDFRSLSDPRKMPEMFEDMPIKSPMLSVLTGAFAATLTGGYMKKISGICLSLCYAPYSSA